MLYKQWTLLLYPTSERKAPAPQAAGVSHSCSGSKHLRNEVLSEEKYSKHLKIIGINFYLDWNETHILSNLNFYQWIVSVWSGNIIVSIYIVRKVERSFTAYTKDKLMDDGLIESC